MKAITGNRLSDGAVIYLDDNDQWTSRLGEAAQFQNKDSVAVLEAVQSRTIELADVYLIEVGSAGAPAGRQALRETIRQSGPTIRSDLGYQAEI